MLSSLTICLFECFVTQVSICELSPPSILPCHCQAAAMFSLLNLIREQAVDVLIFETSGRQALMHYVAFVMSLGSLSFFPSARFMPGVPETLTKMRLIRHIYEHCHQVIVPLCGAYNTALACTPFLCLDELHSWGTASSCHQHHHCQCSWAQNKSKGWGGRGFQTHRASRLIALLLNQAPLIKQSSSLAVLSPLASKYFPTLLWHALLFYAWMSCTAGALPEPALAAATSTTTAQ